MKKFAYGLLTGVVITIFSPVFEALSELALNWIEVLKVPAIKKTVQGNKEIQDIQCETENQGGAEAIGFHYTPQEDEYYDDDEYEDE